MQANLNLAMPTFYKYNYHNPAFQGQEVVADKALEVASTEGHWVILQVLIYMYIHVM